MSRTFSLVILVLCFTTAAGGQDTPTGGAETELRALDRAWAAAELGHDKLALDQILADGFVVTVASGKTVEKAAFIETVMRLTMDSSTKSVIDIIRVHDKVGVVVERFGATLDTKVTWVAMKTGSQWRIISEQMTRIAAPKP